eukprot:TRINITY_DN27974_c0_g1_i1.p1 TRINITY_DN27974_c0_g1~~TRINITY_DN27974_c0_g1_i1.p1  ORF type:complete len:171 (-),score=13.85 TRINITY_DN27974_c0_g1_i1:72-584(-)
MCKYCGKNVGGLFVACVWMMNMYYFSHLHYNARTSQSMDHTLYSCTMPASFHLTVHTPEKTVVIMDHEWLKQGIEHFPAYAKACDEATPLSGGMIYTFSSHAKRHWLAAGYIWWEYANLSTPRHISDKDKNCFDGIRQQPAALAKPWLRNAMVALDRFCSAHRWLSSAFA